MVVYSENNHINRSSLMAHRRQHNNRRTRTFYMFGTLLVATALLMLQHRRPLQVYIDILEEEQRQLILLTSPRPPANSFPKVEKSSSTQQQRQQKQLSAHTSSDTTLNILELSRRHVEPPSNVTAAVCFKTLFGDIDLGIVLQWAAYNRLLGFDHIFMFYRPEVTSLERFDELQSLPYLTLTEQTGGTRKSYYDQWRTEKMCLNKPEFAANFDWAMVADIDEYLKFSHPMGVKQFLQQNDHLTYLSLGKYMYSLDHRVDAELKNHKIDTSSNDHFAVSRYPFYMKHYCYHHRRKSKAICPTWRGRAKVIVRPKYHGKIDVHGNIANLREKDGLKAVHPDTEAHFMEWPEIFARHDVTRHPQPQSFTVQNYDEVHIHDIKKAFNPIDKKGNYLVEYNGELQSWFDFVIGRASTLPSSPISKQQKHAG